MSRCRIPGRGDTCCMLSGRLKSQGRRGRGHSRRVVRDWRLWGDKWRCRGRVAVTEWPSGKARERNCGNRGHSESRGM